jgi:hypothetical protein
MSVKTLLFDTRLPQKCFTVKNSYEAIERYSGQRQLKMKTQQSLSEWPLYSA